MSAHNKNSQQLRVITMRVAVLSDNDSDALSKVTDALSDAGIRPPQTHMLASVPASQELADAYASDDMSTLNELLETLHVAIPFGLDYQMVDQQHGGVATLVSGENSAWIGVENINQNVGIKDGNDGSVAVYIKRTPDYVAADLFAAGAEYEPLSTASAKYSDSQAAYDAFGGESAAPSSGMKPK